MARSRLGESQVRDSEFLSEAEHDAANHYFRDLADVTTYSGGQARKYIRVNSDETGLEYEFDWTEITGEYTTSNYDKLFLNSSGGTFKITLHSNPNMGDTVHFADSGSASTNNITVSGGGGTKILGLNQNYTFNTDYKMLDFVFFNVNTGWIVKD